VGSNPISSTKPKGLRPLKKGLQRTSKSAPTEAVASSKEDDSFTPSQSLLIKLASELEQDVLSEPVFQPQELRSAGFSGCSVKA